MLGDSLSQTLRRVVVFDLRDDKGIEPDDNVARQRHVGL